VQASHPGRKRGIRLKIDNRQRYYLAHGPCCILGAGVAEGRGVLKAEEGLFSGRKLARIIKMAPRKGIRGTTSYPMRSKHVFARLGELVKNNTDLHVVNIGPGLVWKPTAHFLPPQGKTRKGMRVRDTLVKYVDKLARRRCRNSNMLVTHEPFELAEQLHRSLPPNANFSITVSDKYPLSGDAIKSDPRYPPLKEKLQFLRANVETDSLPRSEVVVAQQVLQYVNRERALHNMVSTLKDGGVLLTNDLTGRELKRFGLVLVHSAPDGQIYQKTKRN
jgi:hypothetical protein